MQFTNKKLFPAYLLILLIVAGFYTLAFAEDAVDAGNTGNATDAATSPEQAGTASLEEKVSVEEATAVAPEEAVDPVAEEVPEKPAVAAIEPEEFNLGGFTVSPRGGYFYFLEHSSLYKGYVSSRYGASAGISFDMGGKGFNFEIMPYYRITWLNDPVGDTQNTFLGWHGLGVYSGFSYRWTPSQYAIPSIGVGLGSSYLFGPKISHGFETYLRVPFGLTIYPAKKFGIIFEVGLNYGLTGLMKSGTSFSDVGDNLTNSAACKLLLDEAAKKGQTAVDLAKQSDLCSDDGGFRVGQGFGVDVSLGFRFP